MLAASARANALCWSLTVSLAVTWQARHAELGDLGQLGCAGWLSLFCYRRNVRVLRLVRLILCIYRQRLPPERCCGRHGYLCPDLQRIHNAVKIHFAGQADWPKTNFL